MGRAQGAIRLGSLDAATCGQEAGVCGDWVGEPAGEKGRRTGTPEPLAFLSLQPTGTFLHRSQCPQEVETRDWR